MSFLPGAELGPDADGEDTMNDALLAIVIPAYKAKFLRLALDSIAGQTDQRFVVFVGDDASPEEIEPVCRDYQGLFPLVYHRFEKNVGRESLTQHWGRCISLSDLPWVWLFSDDDVMSPECVERFYETLCDTGERYPVYRFNTSTIDAAGKVLKWNTPHPVVENVVDFACHRFRRQRESFAVEYVFSRALYAQSGGFVDFPLGWCADDASWMRMAGHIGFKLIAGGRVFWRRSGENISSPIREYRMEKLKAAAQYLEWFRVHILSDKTLCNAEAPSMFRPLQRDWFMAQVRSQAPYAITEIWEVRRIGRGWVSWPQLVKMTWSRGRKSKRPELSA
jgi:glycosyltransferase involved in cell wall biosynthesis